MLCHLSLWKIATLVQVIKGVDDNEIELIITKPEGNGDPSRPCILHLHGGAMVNFSAKDPNYTRFRDLLVAQVGRGAMCQGGDMIFHCRTMPPHIPPISTYFYLELKCRAT
jgi:hypothetical protein